MKTERTLPKHIAQAIALVFFALLFALCFVACGKETEPKKLDTPQNLRIEKEILIWDEVAGANGYNVDINGKEYKSETNSLDIFLLTVTPKTYTMRVMAYMGKDAQYNSDWSSSLDYTIIESYGLGFIPKNNDTEYEVTVSNKNKVVGKTLIPSAVNGKPVTSISFDAFKECKGLTSIIIPDSVVSIGAFTWCENLERVRLSESVEKLDISVFEGCSSLTEIEIPRSVKEISNCAFAYCTSLESVYIPDLVEKIGIRLFEGCDNLRTVTVDERNEAYYSDGNCIIKRDTDELVVGCSASVIPDYVTSIEEYAFARCALTVVTIPDTVTYIGRRAFEYTYLTEIKIPGGVEVIDSDAFAGCIALESVTLEEGIKILSSGYSGTFGSCINLTNIHIPASMEKIYPGSFLGCINLSFTVAEGNAVYRSEDGCLMQKEGNVLVSLGCNKVIPDSVEVIGGYSCALGNKAMANVDKDIPTEKYTLVIPEGVHTIETYAFMGNDDIADIILPSTLKTIGSYAFSGCGSLKSLVLPDSLTEIASRSFSGVNLDSVIITGNSKLSLSVSGAISGATIYTSFNELPGSWYVNGNREKGLIANDGVVKNCVFGEENGLLFVDSFTVAEDKDYMYAKWIYSPSRSGYKFVGWANGSRSGELLEITEFKGFHKPFLDYEVIQGLPVGTVVYAVWEPIAQ